MSVRENRSGRPLLEVEELRVHFHGGSAVSPGRRSTATDALAAVDGVSFTVGCGTTLAVAGESGSGKTTLGRAVLGLIPWSSGSVRYDGQAVDMLSRLEQRAFRRRAQIVFQDPLASLNPRLTIGRALEEVLGLVEALPRPARRHRAHALLDRVGLGRDVHRALPHELSGGQRQRACIARALAVDPEFLVLDEPMSALDVSVQAHVINLLQSLQEEFGLTYLLISHDLGVVRLLSDRVLIMKEGRVVEAGASPELLAGPTDPYTQRLVNAALLKRV